jgi:nucleoside-diphosphate-sugar epimerase
MSRALVTGAAGFIGSHLCEALLSEGWAVRGVDSFNDFYDPRCKSRNIAASLDHPGFELIRSDLSDLALGDVLDGADAIGHGSGPIWRRTASSRLCSMEVQSLSSVTAVRSGTTPMSVMS